MSKSMKWMIGAAGLSLLGFVLMAGISGGPLASREHPVPLPNPQELGKVVPGSPFVAAPAARPADEEPQGPGSAGFPKPKKADKLTAPPEVVRQMEKEGQVVY